MSMFLEANRHAALSNIAFRPRRKNQKKSLKRPT